MRLKVGQAAAAAAAAAAPSNAAAGGRGNSTALVHCARVSEIQPRSANQPITRQCNGDGRSIHLQPEHSSNFLQLATQLRAQQPGRAQRREQFASEAWRRGGWDLRRLGNAAPCAAAATSGTMNATSGAASAISHQSLRYSSKPSAMLQPGPLTGAARADKLMPAREHQLQWLRQVIRDQWRKLQAHRDRISRSDAAAKVRGRLRTEFQCCDLVWGLGFGVWGYACGGTLRRMDGEGAKCRCGRDEARGIPRCQWGNRCGVCRWAIGTAPHAPNCGPCLWRMKI